MATTSPARRARPRRPGRAGGTDAEHIERSVADPTLGTDREAMFRS